jgi:23S rRNA (cytidine1920-2'-O)/16S rRNA (cytidine1409-2'-O)-methyltransferase
VGRRRLDTELVRRGLASSPGEAEAAVLEGRVTVSGRAAEKPSTLVAPADPVELVRPSRRFVSRGGDKLDAALERFALDVTGRECLDAGASTGGFTDCLLRRGAARVVSVDVGYGQLAWSLRSDERVSVLERTNVRDLRPEHLPATPSVVVADLSFISLRAAVPVLAGLAADRADLVLLVKPQFEVAPGDVGHGGVVRDPGLWRRAIEDTAAACTAAGLGPREVMASPLTGPAGNVEFLLHAVKGTPEIGLDLNAALAEGRAAAGSS